MDWFAVISNGVYPNPSHTNYIERCGFAVSNGLLGWLSRIVQIKGLSRQRMSNRMN